MGQIKNIKLHIVADIKMLITKAMSTCGIQRHSRKILLLPSCLLSESRRPNRVYPNSTGHPVKFKHVKETITKGSQEIVINPACVNQRTHHGDDLQTFDSLNLRSDVIAALESDGIGEPTLIQTMGIPMIMEGKNMFFASQTGSGKTHMFVAPILDRILERSEQGCIGRLGRPTALVVTPNRELADQILRLFKLMSHYVPIRSLGIIGQNQRFWTRGYSRGLVDVVVATPGLLLKFQSRENIIFSDLHYLILDEADTLMDDSFREATERILELCRVTEGFHMRKPVQCILTAATLPSTDILDSYKTIIPQLEMCESNLHKVLSNITHRFVKTRQQKKLELLIGQLQQMKKTEKCVIFCNTSYCCNWLSKELSTKGIEHSPVHAKVRSSERLHYFNDFAHGTSRVLVATDAASRGLDIDSVTLVINFDCPFNATDYLHRSGRVGRARNIYSRGKEEVVTFITKNSEAEFALKVQKAVLKDKSINQMIIPRSEAYQENKKKIKSKQFSNGNRN